MLKPALLIAALLAAATAQAETARIAVATNFAGTAEKLAEAYRTESGDQIELIAGATGKLYAQITSGAPFDAFLSADQSTPDKLVADGLAQEGTGFTYATGRLVLWSADPATDLTDPAAALSAAHHVAIANPELAPYGKAAIETLAFLGLSADLSGRIVMGENIGQTQTMVASGAADVGFVAASGLGADSGGAVWPVPADLHSPIRQDAVLLMRGADNAAAAGFLAFLQTEAARDIIVGAGYGMP